MSAACYLDTGEKADCFGCESCIQACPVHAISLSSDVDGFRYPAVDVAKCVACDKCRQVCPALHPPVANEPRLTFGGYVKDPVLREASTSGGAFSALVEAWADDETLVFGAETAGLEVRHSSTVGCGDMARFRKSKYLQSEIGDSFARVKGALSARRRVVFSGTPCQIAALQTFLSGEDKTNLLTIEVVCEGVPSPNYIRKFAAWLGSRLGGEVQSVDYRYKDGRKWDFQVMQALCTSASRPRFTWKQDRWFNPFWSVWLQHLISRPSCYQCPFAKRERTADLTLGDLWGVHLYCPDLYGRNGGVSVVFCNTEKGCAALDLARPRLFGRNLKTDDAIRYQGPLRGHIKDNPAKSACLQDLREMSFESFVRKWAKRPTLKLLWQKYVWGNRQKVFVWNLFHRKEREND